MRIVQNPNKVLRQKAEPVKKIDAEIKSIIAKMKKILNSSAAGVALAAPQIGISKSIVVTGYKEIKDKEKNEKLIIPEYILINPKIVKQSEEKLKSEEGCLSLMEDEIRGDVERAKSVEIEAMDENGKTRRIKGKGFFARVLQHEIDHINGILFVDRADPKTIFRVNNETKD